MQFDQFYWAERFVDLGCSEHPIALDKLMPQAAAPQPQASSSRDTQHVLQSQLAGAHPADSGA